MALSFQMRWKNKKEETMASKHTRAPYLTNKHPGWHYEEPTTGRLVTYTMGGLRPQFTSEEIPCMALFVGKGITPILIPLDILVHGIEVAAEVEQAKAKAKGGPQ
jgi:hypothetical protein